VSQVAIGMYQVIFGFDQDVTISVEGEFEYSRGKEKCTRKPEPGTAHIAARTLALLGATITSFEGREDGTLIRVFSSGDRLTIPDSSREYESYQITRPGQTIVVLRCVQLSLTFLFVSGCAGLALRGRVRSVLCSLISAF
jgi:hypothetical protein